MGFAAAPTGDDIKVCGDQQLGKGASLAVGPIYHRGLLDHLRRTARAHAIAVQERAVPKGAGNNGWAMKMERGGTAVAQVAVPLRYMHSPVEVIDLADVDSVVALVAAAIQDLPDDFNLLPEQP